VAHGSIPVQVDGRGARAFRSRRVGTASFTLNFAGSDPGERFRFLLDLDDTISEPFPANPFSNAVTVADLIDGANTISCSVQYSATGYTTTSLSLSSASWPTASSGCACACAEGRTRQRRNS